MSNNKQTALQTLKERLLRDKEIYTKEIFYEIHLYIGGILSDINNELLAMEKEQRISDYYQGADDESVNHGAGYISMKDAERWYNETFGGNK